MSSVEEKSGRSGKTFAQKRAQEERARLGRPLRSAYIINVLREALGAL